MINNKKWPVFETPLDVREIIEYTKLKKRYKKKDEKLRKYWVIPTTGSITMQQMRLILYELKNKRPK